MEGYIGEIRGFAGNFAPRSWAYCAGQLLAISSNTALFSIIGTLYGGDGRTTFALPDLRGRTIIGSGRGNGLSNRNVGAKLGHVSTQLVASNLPSHSHVATSSSSGSGSLSGQVRVPASNEASAANLEASPVNNYLAATEIYTASPSAGNYLGATTEDLKIDLSSFHVDVQIGAAGASASYESSQPALVANYIICLFGIFPSRG